MSGGHFHYSPYQIGYIADAIKEEIENNEKLPYEHPVEWWEFSENACFQENGKRKYSPEVIEELKRAVYQLRVAEIYAKRVDYLLEGDDGEDSFKKRLRQELAELEKNM